MLRFPSRHNGLMPSPDHEPSRHLGRLLWITGACVVAVALALLLAVGALRHLQQATELALLRRELQVAVIERRSLEIELESERLITREELAVALQQRDEAGTRSPLSELAITLLHPREPDATGAAAVVWDPRRQRGVLLVAGLSADAAERTYQLWHDGTPVENTRFAAPATDDPIRIEFTASLARGAAWELRTSSESESAPGAVVLTSR